MAKGVLVGGHATRVGTRSLSRQLAMTAGVKLAQRPWAWDEGFPLWELDQWLKFTPDEASLGWGSRQAMACPCGDYEPAVRVPKFSLGRLVQLLLDVIWGEALLFRGGFKSGGVYAA